MRILILLLLMCSVVLAQNPNTAAYPSAIATDTTLPVASERYSSTLDGGITAGSTTINVVSAVGLTVPAIITIESERILIASKVSNALTVASGGRGFAGSVAATHASGVAVVANMTAYHLNQAYAEVKAIETALGVALANVVIPADINTFTELDTIVADAGLGRRLFHATDCTSLTNGLQGDICVEEDADTLYSCQPTAGGCDTAGEWILSGGGGGGAVDAICWQPDEYLFPDTDPGGFTYDGTQVKWPIVRLSIGDEVQFAKRLSFSVGSSPQCFTSWYFASGGPTTNNVAFDCKFSCITDGEDADGRALGSANASGDIVVPGTATLRSDDSWAASTDFGGCAENDHLIVEFERTTPTGTSAGTDDTQHTEFCVTWTN